jgi:hypothetical protein
VGREGEKSEEQDHMLTVEKYRRINHCNVKSKRTVESRKTTDFIPIRNRKIREEINIVLQIKI